MQEVEPRIVALVYGQKLPAKAEQILLRLARLPRLGATPLLTRPARRVKKRRTRIEHMSSACHPIDGVIGRQLVDG
jgi:hypothetical protein